MPFKYGDSNKEFMKSSSNFKINGKTTSNINNDALDRRFKTLPAAETLPIDETLGGYIFMCNNDTMQEDLKRLLCRQDLFSYRKMLNSTI